jgi:hypothetical protein
MRKVVVSEFVSLDGVIEDPGWTFQFSSEGTEIFGSGVVVLTYRPVSAQHATLLAAAGAPHQPGPVRPGRQHAG